MHTISRTDLAQWLHEREMSDKWDSAGCNDRAEGRASCKDDFLQFAADILASPWLAALRSSPSHLPEPGHDVSVPVLRGTLQVDGSRVNLVHLKKSPERVAV